MSRLRQYSSLLENENMLCEHKTGNTLFSFYGSFSTDLWLKSWRQPSLYSKWWLYVSASKKKKKRCCHIDSQMNECIPGEFWIVSQSSTIWSQRLPTSHTGIANRRDFKWPHTAKSSEFTSGLCGGQEFVNLHLSSGHGTYDWEIYEQRPITYTEHKHVCSTVLVQGLLYTCTQQLWRHLTINCITNQWILGKLYYQLD